MKKSLFVPMLVCAVLMLLAAPTYAAENDYHVYAAENLTLSGTSATGTVVNADYAVMEIFSIASSITDTNAVTATNTIALKIVPANETTAYTIPGCPAQVEGSESMTAISTNAVPVYLYKGDTLQVIQTLASGTNALPNISADYHIKYGAKR
jgi:hypothetical protein